MSAKEAYKTIADQLKKGIKAFPASAQVTLQIRMALDRPDSHIDNILRQVLAEPVLSARLVALANSAAYNPGGREVTDVRTAIARLGLKAVRTVATSMLAHQMQHSTKDPALRKLADQLWEHTAHVSSLAHVLARRVTHTDPEAAMFAGILHDIAGFYMLWRAEKMPELITEDFAEWDESGRALVGSAILDALKVPDTIREGIKHHWEGYLGMPPSGLGDTLMLATVLAPVATPLSENRGRDLGEHMRPRVDMYVGEVSVQDVMVIGAETLQEILQEAAQDVSGLINALKFAQPVRPR